MWSSWMVIQMALGMLAALIFWAIVVLVVVSHLDDWRHRHHVSRHRHS